MQRKVDNLPNLFAQFDAAMATLEQQIAKQEQGEPVPMSEAGAEEPDEGTRFSSANSMVSLVVVGGAIVDVQMHANWLPGKSGIVLTECFDQVIEQLPAK